MFKKVKLYFFTLIDLRFRQIFYRIYYKYRTVPFNKLKLGNFVKTSSSAEFLSEENSILNSMSEFTFLNKKIDLHSRSHFWNDETLPKLWLYNLHYFSYLFNEDNHSHHIELIHKWIDENQYGVGNGWEPYPISLRIANWIKYDLQFKCLDSKSVSSLFDQTFYLTESLEFHLYGNHLFENLKSLLMAGLYFGYEDDGKVFYDLGMKYFNAELSEQFLDDGAHFELSPMYHGIMLEGMLDLVSIHRVYQVSYPTPWDKLIMKMINFYRGMTHPDGEISFFNDSCFNIAKKPEAIFEYSKKLGFDPDSLWTPSQDFKNSGFARFENNHFVMIVDGGKIGPSYIPGHGHADNLSFELSVLGKRFFVNSGISTYDVCEDRLIQRKTKSHNTIEINGEDQSQVWGGFRVAKKAVTTNRSVSITKEVCHFKGDHDSQSLLKKPIHNREIRMEEKSIFIKDLVDWDESFSARAFFHVHPLVVISSDGEGLTLERTGVKLRMRSAKHQFEVESSVHFPEFNKKIENKVIILSLNAKIGASSEVNFELL